RDRQHPAGRVRGSREDLAREMRLAEQQRRQQEDEAERDEERRRDGRQGPAQVEQQHGGGRDAEDDPECDPHGSPRMSAHEAQSTAARRRLYAYWFEKSRSVVAPIVGHNVSDVAEYLIVFVLIALWGG